MGKYDKKASQFVTNNPQNYKEEARYYLDEHNYDYNKAIEVYKGELENELHFAKSMKGQKGLVLNP